MQQQAGASDILFVSNQCHNSKRLVDFLFRLNIATQFQIIDVHNSRLTLPKSVKVVPSLYISSQRAIITGDACKDYILRLMSVPEKPIHQSPHQQQQPQQQPYSQQPMYTPRPVQQQQPPQQQHHHQQQQQQPQQRTTQKQPTETVEPVYDGARSFSDNFSPVGFDGAVGTSTGSHFTEIGMDQMAMSPDWRGRPDESTIDMTKSGKESVDYDNYEKTRMSDNKQIENHVQTVNKSNNYSRQNYQQG